MFKRLPRATYIVRTRWLNSSGIALALACNAWRCAMLEASHPKDRVLAIWGIADVDCRIFFHDKCFDGACSASLFTRFHRECVRTADTFSYHGLVHRAGALFDESAFGDGENAIVDFKYSASPRVTWWFDHHQSAFLTPEDQKDFEAGQ